MEQKSEYIINRISDAKDRTKFKGIVKITRWAKPGPVVLIVTDGTGSIDAVAKECNFKVDDVVEIEGAVNERQGKLQIDIWNIKKSDKDFDEIIEKEAEPKRTNISIKSEGMEKMKPYFIKIAKRIRKAVIEGQPIFIRHHCDADGITSGMMTEQAIKLVMKKMGVDPSHNLYRSPMRAPFYEVLDALKDISFTNKILLGHGQKRPLIVVMDNGSTPEDVLGLKTCKLLGFESLVIDHHNPVVLNNKQTAVDPYISMHLNPYLEGLPGDFNTGMLIHELGRMIDEDFENNTMPAVSVIADRSAIPEAQMYIDMSGKSREELEKIGTAIDFLAYNLRHDGGAGIYEELFTNPEFVDMINDEVNKGMETQLQSALPYLKTQQINGVKFSTIELAKYTMRFTYPTPGKVINIIQDHAAENAHQPVFTLGILPDMIIVRATHPVLPLPQLIAKLKGDLPEANVDGGGHDVAGTIKFVEAHQEAIVENIKKQMEQVDSKIIVDLQSE